MMWRTRGDGRKFPTPDQGPAVKRTRLPREPRRAKLSPQDKANAMQIAADFIDFLPDELAGKGVVSLDAWPDIAQELPEPIQDEKALRAAVVHELSLRGIHVVPTRSELALVLASKGKLTADNLESFATETDTEDAAEARALAKKGHIVLSIHKDGKVEPGVKPAEHYLVLPLPDGGAA